MWTEKAMVWCTSCSRRFEGSSKEWIWMWLNRSCAHQIFAEFIFTDISTQTNPDSTLKLSKTKHGLSPTTAATAWKRRRRLTMLVYAMLMLMVARNSLIGKYLTPRCFKGKGWPAVSGRTGSAHGTASSGIRRERLPSRWTTRRSSLNEAGECPPLLPATGHLLNQWTCISLLTWRMGIEAFSHSNISYVCCIDNKDPLVFDVYKSLAIIWDDTHRFWRRKSAFPPQERSMTMMLSTEWKEVDPRLMKETRILWSSPTKGCRWTST